MRICLVSGVFRLAGRPMHLLLGCSSRAGQLFLRGKKMVRILSVISGSKERNLEIAGGWKKGVSYHI